MNFGNCTLTLFDCLYKNYQMAMLLLLHEQAKNSGNICLHAYNYVALYVAKYIFGIHAIAP